MGSTDDGGIDTPADGLPVRLVSVNDVVSMNLAHFRKAAGLSQQELANRIGWLKQVISTAERSWEGRRSRNFTAGDLIEIASGLGIPVAALLLPPEDDGVAVTYMVDGLHGSGPQPLRDLMPVVMAHSSAYDGESAAVKEFRRRLLATDWHRQGHREAHQQEEDAKERVFRAIAEHHVGVGTMDEQISNLLILKNEIEREVEEASRVRA